MTSSSVLPLRESLRNIANVAETIRLRTSRPSISSSPASTIDSLPLLDRYFPAPETMVDSLIDLGITNSVALRLSDAYLRAASQLHSVHCENARSTLFRCLSAGVFSSQHQSRLLEAHKKLYLGKLNEWRDSVSQKALASLSCSPNPSKPQSVGKPARPPFNTTLLPLLEVCYAKEQFPSRADKTLLATKTGMTYNQIHVWFQNRRSRSKRHGSKSPVSASAPTTANLTSVTRSLNQHTLGGSSSDDKSGLSGCSPGILVEDESFPTRAHPYTFPTVYPPEISGGTDPFPCRFGEFRCLLEQPYWPRRPSSCTQTRNETDVSELCLSMARLCLGDSSQSIENNCDCTGVGSPTPLRQSGCAVTPPYMVHPLQAPLASLIRNVVKHVDQRFNVDESTTQHPVVTCTAWKAKHLSGSNRRQRRTHTLHRKVSVSNRSLGWPLKQGRRTFLSDPDPSTNTIVAASHRSRAVQFKDLTKKTLVQSTTASENRCKEDQFSSAAQTIKQVSDALYSHPTPASTVDSLPSLTYASSSSSASTCSLSPTPSFASLNDDSQSAVLDPTNHQSNEPSLKPHEGCSLCNELPLSLFATDMSLNFTEGPWYQVLGHDSPTYPSYSESFDIISQGLQSSPDFPPPSLTFDLPSSAT